MNTRHARAGFAMPAAIGALVIMGALVTAGFYMARQELRVGVASNHTNMAVNLAQAGANEIMANWNGYQLGNVPVWGDTTITDTTGVGIWTVNITNTNNVIYYLDATGEVTRGGDLWAGATRNIGLVTRLIFADIDPPAALTTRGPVSVKGGAAIIGTDDPPAGWSGYCDTTTDHPGLVNNDTTEVSTTGGGTIDGTPPYDQDSTIVDETFTEFGDMDWDELVALAQLEGKDVSSLGTNINSTGPALDGAGNCDESVLTNWGDTLPSAPCGSYFPLIYHSGPTLRIQSGGIGQGILLVDGTLDLRGSFLFYGIIIVQGSFETQGSGNRIVGAVMAGNATVDEQSMVGASAVQYSSCAVQRSILNNASLSRARPLSERSWIDLSSVLN
ncbi:MAG: hypothetical protein U5R14_04370 [Gemmatimonadota bacterium]|nr:hypothetical protein [Gemmatimonadota bacterium]